MHTRLKPGSILVSLLTQDSAFGFILGYVISPSGLGADGPRQGAPL
jgi:hypothetical protein